MQGRRQSCSWQVQEEDQHCRRLVVGKREESEPQVQLDAVDEEVELGRLGAR